jgi:hypothetical protein
MAKAETTKSEKQAVKKREGPKKAAKPKMDTTKVIKKEKSSIKTNKVCIDLFNN